MQNRYSTEEYRRAGTRPAGVPRHFWGQRKTMNTFMNYRFFFRSSFLLAFLFLFLAGGSPANAQGSDCASNNVPNDTRRSVIWAPAFCQEFNATTPAPPDQTVWSFDPANICFVNNEMQA